MTPPPPSSPDSGPLAWDPIAVRDLVRNALPDHAHPAELVLGRAEADALREFLRQAYGEDAPGSLKSSYYLGLKVREDDSPTRLELTGTKAPGILTGQLAPLWKDAPGRRNRAA